MLVALPYRARNDDDVGDDFHHTNRRSLGRTNGECNLYRTRRGVSCCERGAMTFASVLLAADQATPTAPRYTLLVSTNSGLIEQAQRLRYQVFTSEPGFTLARCDRRA